MLPASDTCSTAACARSASRACGDGGKRPSEQRLSLHLRLRSRECLQHLLLGLRAEARELAQALPARPRPSDPPPIRRPARPELPGRLGPEPGHVHDLDETTGEPVAELRERLQVARLGSTPRSSPAIVPPMPGIWVAFPSMRQLRDRHRGVADPWSQPDGRRRAETRRRRRARAGRRGSSKRSASSEFVGRARATAAMICACGSSSACPPTTSRDNLEPMVRALGEVFATRGARRTGARDRRRLSGRYGRARRPAGS